MKAIKLFLFLGILTLSLTARAVPPLINFQGLLTDTTGALVADGNYSVTFSIYDSLSGGNQLWQETQNLSATSGRITAELGLVTPFDQSVFPDMDIWLGVQIDADPEISPRTRLSSVPHAFKVGILDGADGGEIQGDISVDGKVGIGTASPTAPLTILPVAGYDIQFAPSGGENAEISAFNEFHIGTNSSVPLSLITNSFYRMTISGAGNVGIGTTSPASPLEVFYNNSSSSTPAIAINNTTGFQDVLDFKFGGVTQGRVRMANGGGLSMGTVVPLDVILATDNVGRLVVSPAGNVGIGNFNPAYKLEVSGPVMLGDDSIPSFSAGHSGIYSSAGELFALDAAGNSTLLSPHDSITGEWVFFSKNLKTGRVVKIDMERLVRKFEEMTGEKFMTEEFEN
jgi:hypothetical protein